MVAHRAWPSRALPFTFHTESLGKQLGGKEIHTTASAPQSPTLQSPSLPLRITGVCSRVYFLATPWAPQTMKPSRLFLFSRYLEPVLPLWGSWISLKESGADPETANTWEVRRIGSDQRAAVLVASGRVIWLHRTGYVWRKKNCFAIEIHQLQEWLAPEPLCWLLSLEHDQQFQWNWKSYLFQLVPERKKKKNHQRS